MSTKAQREISHKLRVFSHTQQNGNAAFSCRYFGISQDTFYRWKKNYKQKGEFSLVNIDQFIISTPAMKMSRCLKQLTFPRMIPCNSTLVQSVTLLLSKTNDLMRLLQRTFL